MFNNDLNKYEAISVVDNDAYSKFSASFAIPSDSDVRMQSVYVDYAAFSIAGVRQLALRVKNAAGTVLLEAFAGATLSASQHRYFTFGPHLPNDTTMKAVATGASTSAGYLDTALPEGFILLGGWSVEVLDGANITASDDVTVRFLKDPRQKLRYAPGSTQ